MTAQGTVVRSARRAVVVPQPGARSRAVTGSALQVCIVELEAGFDGAWHSHPNEQIAVVLEGSVTVEWQDATPAPLEAGDAAVLPAGLRHRASTGGARAVMVEAFSPPRAEYTFGARPERG